MDQNAIDEAARLIGAARLAGNRVGPLPETCRPVDEDAGYAVQAALHGWLAEAGQGPCIGWKLGCTTKVMQDLVGVDAPVFGGITATAMRHGDSVFEPNAFQAPGAECEIAVRLGADVPGDAGPYDKHTIAPFVDAAMVAMEVVDNRYGDWAAIGTPTLIADDFFQAACVLGTPVADWRTLDLAAITGRTIVDGREVGTGSGADVMGHPLTAAAWLANSLAGRGRTLHAGDIVLTGSVVATQWIDACPCEVTVDVAGLGAVSARFS